MELQLSTTVTVTVETDLDCGVRSPFVFLLAQALGLTVSDRIALRKGSLTLIHLNSTTLVVKLSMFLSSCLPPLFASTELSFW